MTGTEEDAPPRLYKYRSLAGEGLEFSRRLLLENELWHASPTAFNDPFDTLPAVVMEGSKAEHDIYFKRLISEYAGERHRTERRRLLNSMRGSSSRERLDMARNSADQMVQALAVCSLSARHDHILMWSHYADNHAGACFEFDHTGDTFNGDLPLPVAYANLRPVYNPVRGAEPADLTDMLLTKAEFWRYEEEWRLLATTGGPGIRKFRPEGLTAVYLGCRISPSAREMLLSWIGERPGALKVFEGYVNPMSWELEFRPLA